MVAGLMACDGAGRALFLSAANFDDQFLDDGLPPSVVLTNGINNTLYLHVQLTEAHAPIERAQSEQRKAERGNKVSHKWDL